MKTYLSVIIPCYNEKENLQRGVLLGVYRYLKEQKFSWEVIISDDGSTDGSLKLIKRFAKQHKGFRVLENKHGGKPWAVFKGTQVARGQNYFVYRHGSVNADRSIRETTCLD